MCETKILFIFPIVLETKVLKERFSKYDIEVSILDDGDKGEFQGNDRFEWDYSKYTTEQLEGFVDFLVAGRTTEILMKDHKNITGKDL